MNPRTVALLGLLGGLGTAAVWGWIIHVRELKWRLAWGRVVEVVSKQDEDRVEVFAPVITFRDREGREQTFLHSLYGSEQGFRIGQEVRVSYDPEAPDNAHLHSIWTKYYPCWVALMVAVVSLVLWRFPDL